MIKVQFLGFFCLSLMLGAAGQAMAAGVERSAGSGMDTQMTWSALSTQIDAANVRITGLDAKLSQSILCGKLNKLYSPGAPGADANGCKDLVLTGNPDYINLVNSLNATNTNVTNLKNSVNTTNTYNTNEQKCTAQGMVYAPGQSGADGNGCKGAVAGKSCSMNVGAACGGGGCVVIAKYPYPSKSTSGVPSTWRDGESYYWHYAATSNDYGGGQCINGTIHYFTTGN